MPLKNIRQQKIGFHISEVNVDEWLEI